MGDQSRDGIQGARVPSGCVIWIIVFYDTAINNTFILMTCKWKYHFPVLGFLAWMKLSEVF